MPLNDLSLDQLAEMSANLMTLHAVGADLATQGLEPVFDLTPGQLITITVPFSLPAAAVPQRLPTRVEMARARDSSPDHAWIDRTVDLVRGMVADSAEVQANGTLAITLETPSSESAPGPAELAPLDVPPAASHAGGMPDTADPSRSGDVSAAPSLAAHVDAFFPASAALPEGTAASGGEGGSGSAVSPAAPVSGLASALVASSIGTNWTAEEDERLIDLVVMGMVRLGLGKTAAIRSAAQELGRPFPGTEFRCKKNHVREGIDAALAKERRQAEVMASLPKPHENASAPLIAHLMALPEKGGWTADRDLELVELSIAQWPPEEIALQLQVTREAVKQRFDLLTGLHEDASGRKVRHFTRDQVFAALQKLAGKAA